MNDTSVAADVPETAAEDSLPRPGAYIAARREAAGLTQAQVGETLHLTLHYIRALENDEYRKLPGLTFVKGYFRAYARLLRIDEAEVLGYYDRYVATLDIPEAAQPQTLHIQQRRSDQTVSWALITGILLAIGLGAGWWFFGRDLQPAPLTSISLPQQVQSTPQPQPATQVVQSLQPSPAVPPSSAAQSPQALEATQASQAETSGAAADATPATPTAAALTETDAGVVNTQADDDSAAGNAGAVSRDTAIVSDPSSTPDISDTADTADTADDGAEPGTEAVPEAAGQDAAAEPAAAVQAPGNNRRIELAGNGDDRLRLQFTGSSWVEVDDASQARLYSGMMGPADSLNIRASAPFHVLLGDARGVELELNDSTLAVQSMIRNDNSARILVTAEGLSPWVVQ